jgi:putative iron-only hydrogenase system regulator
MLTIADQMEKRIGAAVIIIEKSQRIDALNKILSAHSEVLLGRQGIPLRERNLSVISLVFEGTTDEIGSLTGQLGKLPGIRVRSVFAT